jgi:hypothetical protein
MQIKKMFAKSMIAAALGVAALGLSTGVGHAAPPSPVAPTTVWVQGGGWDWGPGHHGWGPGWGRAAPWYWAPPPPPPPWGYPGYYGGGWGGWGC